MRLWTAQTKKIYEKLIETGSYHADPNQIPDFPEIWKSAYDWMVQKMTELICPPPEGVTYPVWFWYKWNGRNHQPDLRSRRSFGEKGEQMVILEVEFPEERVLLSDFDAWHSVLNNCHTYHDTDSKEEFDKLSNWLDSLSESERRAKIIRSWDSVFDITPYESEYKQNGVWVQATAWELKASDIKKIKHFTC